MKLLSPRVLLVAAGVAGLGGWFLYSRSSGSPASSSSPRASSSSSGVFASLLDALAPAAGQQVQQAAATRVADYAPVSAAPFAGAPAAVASPPAAAAPSPLALFGSWDPSGGGG